MLRQGYINFPESRIPQESGGIQSGLLRELGGGRQHQRLVTCLIVPRSCRHRPGLRQDLARAIHEAHHRGLVENVLIVSHKEKCAVAADWTSHRKAELLLGIAWLDVPNGTARVETAVPQVIKAGAVKFVGPGLCDYIEHGSARPA